MHVEMSDCSCCTAVEVSRRDTMPSLDAVSTLSLKGHLQEVLEANEQNLPTALSNVFGEDGLSAIFGRSSADGAKRLRCGGFNHVFMIELGGKLAKCIRPHGGAGGDCSEVVESERLRHHFPSLCQDQQVLFPQAAFLCKGMASTRYICEVMVFDFLPGCQSVADLCRDFERTHPCGVRRQAASCAEHRALEEDKVNCEHFRALQALVRRAASLGRHFQQVHGRRHGDFKADNILVDQHGNLLLSDFLSPFCAACDRNEFQTSIQSGHPICQDLQQVFEEEWQAPACQLSNEAAQRRQVAWLAGEMRKLSEVSSQQSIFGPLPDLLQSISAWSSPPKMSAPQGALGLAEKLPANESPSFSTALASPIATSPITTISSPSGPSFSWFESTRSSGTEAFHRTNKAWGHANTAPLAGVASSPVPMKGFFTEPNLLEHAKLIIAATQDSPAASTWQTPSWAGSSLSSPTPTWSQPGFGDPAPIYVQENRGTQRARRSSAPSPFFPSNDLIAMHKASLRLGEVPQ